MKHLNQQTVTPLIENKQARLLMCLSRLTLLANRFQDDEHAIEMIADCVKFLAVEADELIAIRDETDNEILWKFFGLVQHKRKLQEAGR